MRTERPSKYERNFPITFYQFAFVIIKNSHCVFFVQQNITFERGQKYVYKLGKAMNRSDVIEDSMDGYSCIT